MAQLRAERSKADLGRGSRRGPARRASEPESAFDDVEKSALNCVAAAQLARDAGFHFVDIKQCHGYLGHELLGARTRDGKYGGPLENRTRFARSVIHGIQASVPGLQIVVRMSVFDFVPFRKGSEKV